MCLSLEAVRSGEPNLLCICKIKKCRGVYGALVKNRRLSVNILSNRYKS